MKNLKNTSLFVSVILSSIIFLSSCGKETVTPVFDEELLVSKWELTGLVNISDEHKYLKTVLEISSDFTYSNKEEDGSAILNGTWKMLDNTNVQLSLGLFDGETIEYSLKKIDNSTLILEEHYTKDNKDTYLEYQYTKVNPN